MVGKEINEQVSSYIKKMRTAKKWSSVAVGDKSLPFKIAKALKDNKCVTLLLDLWNESKSAECDFFGIKTKTPISAAVLAKRFNKPVVGCMNHRDSSGKHIFTYKFLSKPPYSENTTEQELTQIYTTAIEEHIRNFPEQWRWPEIRWKQLTFE